MHKTRSRTHGRSILLLTLVLLIFAASATAVAAAGPLQENPSPMAPANAARAIPKIGDDTPLVDSEDFRIYGLNLHGSNAFMIETPEGVTLVDAGMPISARRVLRKLEAIGRPDDLCQIYITHAHLDHFGAAAALREKSGAPIIIHEADAKALAVGRTELGSVRNWEWSKLPLPAIERLIEIAPTPPDQTVVDGEAITSCGLDAKVVHTPGHTPGSSTLLVTDPATGNSYAFVGDLFSTMGGLHAQSSYAHNWGHIAVSIQAVREHLPTLIFPGHGDSVITQDELLNYIISGPAAP